jgi:hypothetical protein
MGSGFICLTISVINFSNPVIRPSGKVFAIGLFHAGSVGVQATAERVEKVLLMVFHIHFVRPSHPPPLLLQLFVQQCCKWRFGISQ